MKKKIVVALVICMMLISVIALSACSAKKITAPLNVEYDGTTIIWSELENVRGYNIKITDAAGALILEQQPVANKFVYDAKGKDFTVQLFGIAKSDRAKDPEVLTVNFKALATIANKSIKIDNNGGLSWPSVKDASSYLLKINNDNPITVKTNSYNGLLSGEHVVSVKAMSEDKTYFSTYGEAIKLTILQQPQDVKYDGTNITWGGTATQYEVLINDKPLPSSQVNGTVASYDSHGKDFTVAVKAVGDHKTTFDSRKSEVKKFMYLSTVTNIRMESGKLTWDSVSGATGYMIRLNGIIQSGIVADNSYDKLLANTDYEIEILPITTLGEGIANWSAKRNIRILPAPIIRWQPQADVTEGKPANCIIWNGVNGAESYTVYIVEPNGRAREVARGQNEHELYESFTLTGGAYTVKVVANAPSSNADLSGSSDSNIIKVTRLSAPKESATNFITSDPNNLSGFTVSYQQVAGAKGYQLYKSDATISTGVTPSLQIKVPSPIDTSVTAETNINYNIKSIGDVSTINGITTARLNSIDKLSFDIKVQAMPTNVDMAGYDLTWDAVGTGNRYAIFGMGKGISAENNTYNLAGIEAGDYSPRIATRGDGGKTLPSNATAQFNLTRLQAPHNIRIAFEDLESGKLLYDGDPRAKGYMAYIGGIGGAPTDVSKNDNIADKIKEIGTSVHVYANANYWDTNHKIYYMESQTSATVMFMKLKAPTFGGQAFTNTEFKWEHAHNDDYAPTYKVYNGKNNEKINGEISGTRLDITKLNAGQVSYKVKAIGDGKKYINSELSEIKVITKLDAPNISIDGDSYNWNAVMDASSYQLRIDNETAANEIHVNGKTYSHVPKLLKKIGNHQVQLVAIGDGGNSTIDSNVVTIEQKVVKLTTPTFTVSYSHTAVAVDGEIQITIKDQPKFASGYKYVVGGVVSDLIKGTSYSVVKGDSGDYKISVVAFGGVFDTATKEYYVNSSETPSQTITLLPITAPERIEVTGQGRVTWGVSPNAVSYKFEYQIGQSGTWITIDNITNSYFDIPDYTKIASPTVISMRITANGNADALIITSRTVETIFNK